MYIYIYIYIYAKPAGVPGSMFRRFPPATVPWRGGHVFFLAPPGSWCLVPGNPKHSKPSAERNTASQVQRGQRPDTASQVQRGTQHPRTTDYPHYLAQRVVVLRKSFITGL